MSRRRSLEEWGGKIRGSEGKMPLYGARSVIIVIKCEHRIPAKKNNNTKKDREKKALLMDSAGIIVILYRTMLIMLLLSKVRGRNGLNRSFKSTLPTLYKPMLLRLVPLYFTGERERERDAYVNHEPHVSYLGYRGASHFQPIRSPCHALLNPILSLYVGPRWGAFCSLWSPKGNKHNRITKKRGQRFDPKRP